MELEYHTKNDDNFAVNRDFFYKKSFSLQLSPKNQFSALTQDPFLNIVYPVVSKYSTLITLFNENIVHFLCELEDGYLKEGTTGHNLVIFLDYSINDSFQHIHSGHTPTICS